MACATALLNHAWPARAGVYSTATPLLYNALASYKQSDVLHLQKNHAFLTNDICILPVGMDWTTRPIKAAGLTAFVLLAFAASANAVAVMSIDIGSEWMKIAVVSVRNLSIEQTIKILS